MASPEGQRCLLCRAGDRVYALWLPHVVETMRALPIAPCAGAPGYVLGVSIVRGQPLPVVDLDAVLGGSSHTPPERFVTVRVGSRQAVLAVHAVIGVRTLSAEDHDNLPPLLAGAHDRGIEALAVLDADLLLVLQSARLVPDEAFAAAAASATQGAG